MRTEWQEGYGSCLYSISGAMELNELDIPLSVLFWVAQFTMAARKRPIVMQSW